MKTETTTGAAVTVDETAGIEKTEIAMRGDKTTSVETVATNVAGTDTSGDKTTGADATESGVTETAEKVNENIKK